MAMPADAGAVDLEGGRVGMAGDRLDAQRRILRVRVGAERERGDRTEHQQARAPSHAAGSTWSVSSRTSSTRTGAASCTAT